MIDYKISGEYRDGKKTVIDVRFYEGEVTTEVEDKVEVTRYRRTKMIGEKTFTFEGDLPKEKVVPWLNEKLGVEAEKASVVAIEQQATFDKAETAKLVLTKETTAVAVSVTTKP